MRAIIARVICAFTGCVVVALSLRFASVRNRSAEPGAGSGWSLTSGAVEPASVARGRTVYDEQGCASCHSIAGRGNPRHPLDAVGARRSDTELREWITGTGHVDLPAAIVRRKAKYRDLPVDDLRALEVYLQGLPAAH